MPPRNDAGGLLTILANASCPHCVHATDTLTDWCSEAGIPVAGLDVAHFREFADEHRIEHSPSILYRTGERERVFSGMPTHDEFLRFTRG